MKKLKLIAALVVTMAIAVFLWLNIHNQARLRLFREFEVSTLMLVGVAYFAGMASVVLFNLWRHQRAGRAAGKRIEETVSDRNL